MKYFVLLLASICFCATITLSIVAYENRNAPVIAQLGVSVLAVLCGMGTILWTKVFLKEQ